jgi:hypothetical protein
MNKTRFSQPSKGLRPSHYNSRKLNLVKVLEPYMKNKNSVQHPMKCTCESCYTPKGGE